MDFQLRSNYTTETEKIVTIGPEEIANQVVGSRIEFQNRHDIIFQFADGSVTLDDIDLIIYIMPNQFFCYRQDEVLATVVLETRTVDIDLRNPGNGANGRAFFRAADSI